MKKFALRLVKGEGRTKNGNRTFPRYYAVYAKNGERAYVDVSFSGDTLDTFLSFLKTRKSSYLDVALSFATTKADRDNQEAFIAPKRKKQDDGTYTYITDHKGNRIPHIVVLKLSEKDVFPEGKELALPESKQQIAYEADNFFGSSKENISKEDSELPF